MRLSTWRTDLLLWLPKVIRVDGWLIDRPEVGKSVGFLPPLRNLAYEQTQAYEVKASAVQDLVVQLRYPDSTTYKDLPIAALEGAYQTFAYYLAVFFQDITPELTDCVLMDVNDPVVVSETGDRSGEWLVTLRWSFMPSWYATPEPNPLTPAGPGLEPGFPVTRISAGVWRQKLAEEMPPVLDFRLAFDKTP